MRGLAWRLLSALALMLILVGLYGLRAGPPADAPKAPPPPAAGPAGPPAAPSPAAARPVTLTLPPGTKLVHGRRDVKAIALTIDDGPHPGYTRRILEVLSQYHARVTFFVVGKMAAAHPELIAEEHAQGHLVANHSYNHPEMARLSRRTAREEWARCSQVIQEVTGEQPLFCRPPVGHYSRTTLAAAGDEGMSMVLWTRYPADIGKPGVSTIVARTVRGIRSGEVILLHDGIEQTIQALPQIITDLRAQGFELVTIDEMAAAAASPPPPPAGDARQARAPSHTMPRGTG